MSEANSMITYSIYIVDDEETIREEIRAIVQPGGSLRDFEIIEACNEADPQVTMLFTGQRAFKH